jgi:hypothetical protein
VNFTPGLPAIPADFLAKPLGMVLVEEPGLIVKLRGLKLESSPDIPCSAAFCLYAGPTTIFVFLFDGGSGFL